MKAQEGMTVYDVLRCLTTKGITRGSVIPHLLKVRQAQDYLGHRRVPRVLLDISASRQTPLSIPLPIDKRLLSLIKIDSLAHANTDAGGSSRGSGSGEEVLVVVVVLQQFLVLEAVVVSAVSAVNPLILSLTSTPISINPNPNPIYQVECYQLTQDTRPVSSGCWLLVDR